MRIAWWIVLSVAVHSLVLALPVRLPEGSPRQFIEVTLLIEEPSLSPGNGQEPVLQKRPKRQEIESIKPVRKPTAQSTPKKAKTVQIKKTQFVRKTLVTARSEPREAKEETSPKIGKMEGQGKDRTQEALTQAAVSPLQNKERAKQTATSPPAFDGPAVEGIFGHFEGPKFLERVMPSYPRRARKLGKEGLVVLRLSISEEGKLITVEVVEGAGDGFDKAAIKAIRQSKFLPAKRNGKPVACQAVVPVRFKLTR